MQHLKYMAVAEEFSFFFLFFCILLKVLACQLLLLLIFLILRNVDSPLGRFLKGGADAARNIYSFGFGKVRCCGKQLSNDFSTVFQTCILHRHYPACVIFSF